ncbi:signal peptidase I [Microbacterium invictum]|uniref:Signal peptidase I n=1 Tax=Microbacterium invictum TaxID=515415 RepID=A0AA40SNG7_9MICO|nr:MULTISPECIES: signal peptidase I [Microbacterium]MBB4139335.1 signal peptidase [Microbacterium invictum]
MQLLRRLSLGLLWLLAGVGILCGLVWGATAAGVIKPLVVISGSMEPGIMTGDLLIATKADTADLRVGDVVSLPSELTESLVTHRIESIEQTGTGQFAISMKGDNNEFSDALDYAVGASVWKPTAQLAGMGTVVTRITTPAVVMPLLIGLGSLLGLSLLIPPAPQRRAHSAVAVNP